MIPHETHHSAPGEHTERPGLPEVAVGVIVMAVVGFGLGSQIPNLGFDRVSHGLVFTGWSAVAGFAGFGAAWLVRRRPISAFGARSITRRWLLIGIAAGVVAFVLKGLAVLAFTAATGIGSTPQGVYAEGGGGFLSAVAATLLLGVFTPLGEEFLFRGVVTNALLRYGAFVGVVLSALIFALLPGINIVFPAAFIEDLIAGELFRRSGSIWPPVIVHVACNSPTIPVMILAANIEPGFQR